MSGATVLLTSSKGKEMHRYFVIADHRGHRSLRATYDNVQRALSDVDRLFELDAEPGAELEWRMNRDHNWGYYFSAWDGTRTTAWYIYGVEVNELSLIEEDANIQAGYTTRNAQASGIIRAGSARRRVNADGSYYKGARPAVEGE